MAKRKEEVAELVAPDPFVERANQYAEWIQKNLRSLLLGLGVAGGLTAALLIGLRHGERTDAAATAALGKGVKSYEEFMMAARTSTGGAALAKATEQALPPLAKVASDHPGTGAARLAELYRADVLRRSGKTEEAAKLLSAYADAAKPGDALLPVVIESVGAIAEDRGDLDGALAQYVRVGGLEGSFLKDRALIHQARVLAAKGDPAKAKEKLKELLDKFPESKLRDEAEQQLAELE